MKRDKKHHQSIITFSFSSLLELGRPNGNHSLSLYGMCMEYSSFFWSMKDRNYDRIFIFVRTVPLMQQLVELYSSSNKLLSSALYAHQTPG